MQFIQGGIVIRITFQVILLTTGNL